MKKLNVKQARVNAGLSIERLAEMAGTYLPTISLIERGIHKPQARTREKLEKVLGPIDWDAEPGEVDPDNVLVKQIAMNLYRALRLPKEHREEVLEILKTYAKHLREELAGPR